MSFAQIEAAEPNLQGQGERLRTALRNDGYRHPDQTFRNLDEDPLIPDRLEGDAARRGSRLNLLQVVASSGGETEELREIVERWCRSHQQQGPALGLEQSAALARVQTLSRAARLLTMDQDRRGPSELGQRTSTNLLWDLLGGDVATRLERQR